MPIPFLTVRSLGLETCGNKGGVARHRWHDACPYEEEIPNTTANTSPDIFACGCCCHIVGRDQGCCATKCPAAVCASLAKVEKPWSRALSKVLRGLKCQARQQCFVISGSIIVGFTIYGVKNLVLEFCKSNSRDWGTVAPDLISWNEWTSGYSAFCNLVSHLVGSFQALACVDLILTAPFL